MAFTMDIFAFTVKQFAEPSEPAAQASEHRLAISLQEHWHEWEEIRCERSILRMRKYAARGFTFEDTEEQICPPIQFFRTLNRARF